MGWTNVTEAVAVSPPWNGRILDALPPDEEGWHGYRIEGDLYKRVWPAIPPGETDLYQVWTSDG